KQDALISKELVKLKDDVPESQTLESFAVRPIDYEKAFSFLREQNFNALINRLEKEAPSVPPKEISYELIQDVESLNKWISSIRSLGYVAFDTETNSLNAIEAELVGFS